jgi:hypothetical protein
MHRLLLALLALGSLTLAAGCAYSPMEPAGAAGAAGPGMEVAPVMPPPGFLFAQVKAPLSTDYDNTTAKPPKMGQARSMYVMIPFVGLSFAWMDQASVAAAATAGGITEVKYADYEIFNVLGFFKMLTVITYGN